MKSVQIPKIGEFVQSSKRGPMTNTKKNKGEIVLRIVSNRLN